MNNHKTPNPNRLGILRPLPAMIAGAIRRPFILSLAAVAGVTALPLVAQEQPGQQWDVVIEADRFVAGRAARAGIDARPVAGHSVDDDV